MTRMTLGDRITYAIRVAVAHVLYYAGVLHVVQRVRLKRKAVVLMYHRVLTPDQQRRTGSHPGLVVERSTFGRQMAVVKRLFTVLTLEEFADRLERREPFNGPCCLITFDDGWIDNWDNAFPILRAHGLPAAIFLPVNFVGSRRLFTREALTFLLVKASEVAHSDASRREPLRACLAPLGLADVIDRQHGDPLVAAIEALHPQRFASQELEELVDTLARELGISEAQLPELDQFIDWAQVEQMAHHGVTFGAHGAEHRVLTRVSPEVARFEVDRAKDVLETRLGVAPCAFAYPNGGWNAAIADVVKTAGYRMAFTVEPGLVSCDDDRFTLKRINIHEGMTRSMPMFLARVTGVI